MTKSQSAELAGLLAKLRPGAKALAPKVARALVRHAKALHRLYEHRCNRELTLAEQAVEIRHEKAVERLCKTVEIEVRFNGDPRGFPVKLHFGGEPFAYAPFAEETGGQPYNTWGGASEGWGIG